MCGNSDFSDPDLFDLIRLFKTSTPGSDKIVFSNTTFLYKKADKQYFTDNTQKSFFCEKLEVRIRIRIYLFRLHSALHSKSNVIYKLLVKVKNGQTRPARIGSWGPVFTWDPVWLVQSNKENMKNEKLLKPFDRSSLVMQTAGSITLPFFTTLFKKSHYLIKWCYLLILLIHKTVQLFFWRKKIRQSKFCLILYH